MDTDIRKIITNNIDSDYAYGDLCGAKAIIMRSNGFVCIKDL